MNSICDIIIPPIYFDILSFLVTPLSPYFIVAGIYKTFNLNKEGLMLFGNLAVGFGFIGTILGWIIMGHNIPLDKEGVEFTDFLLSSFAAATPERPNPITTLCLFN